MYRILLTTAAIMLFAATFTFAQAPVIEWETVIGGENSDKAVAVYQTDDGGYIVGGSTNSFGENKRGPFFIKLNSDGDTLWTRVWGDSLAGETVNEFIPTSGGGYMVVGSYNKDPITSQFFMLRLDANCDSQWVAMYGNPNYIEHGYGIAEGYGGGYVLTGAGPVDTLGNQVTIIKTNDTGSMVWEQHYGLVGSDVGYCIIQTDGGYLIAGESPNFNDIEWNFDLFLMKTNASGDTLWTKSYGGLEEERAYRVRETADGGYIAVGHSISFGGGYTKDWYIVRTDANGDTLWTRSYGNPYEDVAMDVKELPDNKGFLVAGGIHDGLWNAHVLCLSANGDSLWAVEAGGDGYEIAYGIELTDDGGFVICGQTDSYGAGGYDIYIVKFSSFTVSVDDDNDVLPREIRLHQNYPNPFNPFTAIEFIVPRRSNVSITVFDLLGRHVIEIVNDEYPAGSHHVTWDGNTSDGEPAASGIYFYRIETEDYTETRKMLLLK